MDYVEFVTKAVNIFAEKKRNKEIIKNRVRRGRAPSSAPEIENLLSVVIAAKIPQKYTMLVDYPLSYQKNECKPRTIHPDIVIINNKTIVGVIELKIDLGRLAASWVTENDKKLIEIQKAGNIRYNENTGTGPPERKVLQVSNPLSNCVIVLTEQNDHNKMADFKTSTNCFVLCGGPHPNDAVRATHEIIKQICAVENDWSEFVLYLTNTFR